MLPVSDMRGVHEWFLHRGLPLVLTRRVRSRALIERSAPMASGIGAAIALTMTLAELTDGDPDFGYAVRLGVRRPPRTSADAEANWAGTATGTGPDCSRYQWRGWHSNSCR